jgi:hypothetical protein
MNEKKKKERKHQTSKGRYFVSLTAPNLPTTMPTYSGKAKVALSPPT